MTNRENLLEECKVNLMKNKLEEEFFTVFDIKLSRPCVCPFFTYIKLLRLSQLCFNYDFSIHSKSIEEFQAKMFKVLIYNSKDKEIYTKVRETLGIEA